MKAMKFVRHLIVSRKTREMHRILNDSQDLARQIGGPVHDYNLRMAPHREYMQQRISAFYTRLENNPKCEELIHLFLIHFSSIGSHMVKKANVWLTTWGEAMNTLGFREIGEDFKHHALEEVGHDQWHRNDVKRLAQVYRKKYGRALNPERIIKNAESADCVRDYYQLSENVITGKDSYLCLAELYETEVMALNLAPDFIGYCVAELGFQILKCLSFLRGHMVSDVDHIRDNIKQMDLYLKNNVHRLPELEAIGRRTIDIYIRYFEQALSLAERQLNQPSEEIEKVVEAL